MCFSAEADFAVAAGVLPVGVATLRACPSARVLPVAALPLLLALHQLTEGVVWLGLRDHVAPGVRQAAIAGYLGFAQVALPVLVPLALALIEPGRRRRQAMLALLAVGAAVAARFAWILTAHPIGARESDRVIVYDTDWEFGYAVAAAYVVATCGPALLSSSRALRWFGGANLVGLGIAAAIRYSAVTSLWCVWAALVSAFVYLHVRGLRHP